MGGGQRGAGSVIDGILVLVGATTKLLFQIARLLWWLSTVVMYVFMLLFL